MKVLGYRFASNKQSRSHVGPSRARTDNCRSRQSYCPDQSTARSMICFHLTLLRRPNESWQATSPCDPRVRQVRVAQERHRVLRVDIGGEATQARVHQSDIQGMPCFEKGSIDCLGNMCDEPDGLELSNLKAKITSAISEPRVMLILSEPVSYTHLTLPTIYSV